MEVGLDGRLVAFLVLLSFLAKLPLDISVMATKQTSNKKKESVKRAPGEEPTVGAQNKAKTEAVQVRWCVKSLQQNKRHKLCRFTIQEHWCGVSWHSTARSSFFQESNSRPSSAVNISNSNIAKEKPSPKRNAVAPMDSDRTSIVSTKSRGILQMTKLTSRCEFSSSTFALALSCTFSVSEAWAEQPERPGTTASQLFSALRKNSG